MILELQFDFFSHILYLLLRAGLTVGRAGASCIGAFPTSLDFGAPNIQ